MYSDVDLKDVVEFDNKGERGEEEEVERIAKVRTEPVGPKE